jgi:signal transduction histidine kinase
MLYCDLLIAGLQGDPRLSHHAEEIRLASKHGANLIQQLLAVARNRVPQAHSQSLNHVIAGIRELLARLIGENIELRMDLAESLGKVQIDPGQAQQIILNLVLNSRDAMPNGGRITLQTRNGVELLPAPSNPQPRLAPCIELTVSDTGVGMDEETRSRVWNCSSPQSGTATDSG